MTDTDSGQTAHRAVRVALVLTLVLMTTVAPAAAQTNETNQTAPCAVGPPIYNEQPDDSESQDLSVALVADRSASMSTGTRMEDLKTALDGFVARAEQPDRIGLASFGSSSRIDSELTTDYGALQSDIDTLSPDSEFGTAFAAGINDGSSILDGAAENSTKVMVFSTDATPSSQSETDAINAAQAAKDDGVIIFAVGFGDEIDEQFLSEVATGDRVYTSPDSGDLDSIYQEISQDIEAIDSQLIVETRDLFKPGATHKYTIYERIITENNRTIRNNVTAEASVTSSNTTVLSVDESSQTLSATADTNTSTWVRVDATANGSTGCTNVIVSEANVSALPLLPGIWRFTAVLGDATLFALLLSTFCAVAMTRFTSAFGGLAVGQLGMTVGWLAGYVSWAIAAASLFVVLFIGLNLAERTSFAGGNLRNLQ